jgi:hypothetical protein
VSETEDYDKSSTPTAHAATHESAGSDEISVGALSGELADDQKSTWTKVSGKPTTFTPESHKTTHQDGGSDEISVAGLSGLLADGQTPIAHKTSHQDGGSDEISVASLSGVLADDQHIIDAEAVSAMGAKANSNPLNHDRYADSEALAAAVQSGAITDGVTKAPTHDAVYDVKVMTEGHKTRHQLLGDDAISVAGLSGHLADAQDPVAHKTSHQDGGSDEIDCTGLAGRCNLVDRGDPSPRDFSVANLITDGFWRDLNLSAIIPAGATFVLLRVILFDDAVNTIIQFRKNGNTNDCNTTGLRTQVANVETQGDLIVALDSNRIIKYQTSITTITYVYITVAGWWI